MKTKIGARKKIDSKYVIPLTEHEAFQKETMFDQTNLDYCFFRRPTFDLKLVMEVKKERSTGLTTLELETLLRHQVG